MNRLVDYTADLHDLAALVAGGADTDDVLDRALAALAALIPHDLAVVFRLDGVRLRAVAATLCVGVRQPLAHLYGAHGAGL